MSAGRWVEKLNALVDQAEREGKALYCSYQNLWFLPAELRAEHASGRFIWAIENWALRDPEERTAQLVTDVVLAKEALSQWMNRIGAIEWSPPIAHPTP